MAGETTAPTETDKENAGKQLLKDGYRTDGSSQPKVHGVMSVGRISFLYTHPFLKTLHDANPEDFSDFSQGSVYLTGLKLEDTLLSVDNFMDNAKLIPLLNGDTMTLTNSNKSGTLTLSVIRTAAGLSGGDIIAIGDFVRSQGDSVGGTLKVAWQYNGKDQAITFKNVCFQRVPPLGLAGNDLPSLSVTLTFADYEDASYPVW